MEQQLAQQQKQLEQQSKLLTVLSSKFLADTSASGKEPSADQPVQLAGWWFYKIAWRPQGLPPSWGLRQIKQVFPYHIIFQENNF